MRCIACVQVVCGFMENSSYCYQVWYHKSCEGSLYLNILLHCYAIFVYLDIEHQTGKLTGTYFNLIIGCPPEALAHGDKCYWVNTTIILNFGHAWDFCSGLTPAGKLILPDDEDQNAFIQSLANVTG